MILRILFSQTLLLSVYLLSGCKESFPEPLVSFEKDKSTARVGEPVSLTNTSQNAASYEWDFGDGISTAHHPNWTTEVIGVYEEIGSNDSHTWIGILRPGIYTLVSAGIFPLTVWYVAGLTVKYD